MAQRDDDDRQQQQGSTGQRSEGEGGGHRQADLPGDHGGQQGGKAGVGDKGEQRPNDGRSRDSLPGATERTGGEQQRQQQQPERRGEADGDEPGRGARVTQGNLGTTQREWSQRDDTVDSDEE
jgi:hypothetical protein